ncbi:unnamed protein product [Vitrella brassicaformis CCMP3155]|uniref:Uncharacterized protein n=1 Tax=Vitrella brassicaformis (strain CCMP3155) TaxID=1169540 RepID=A0A0G4ED56_VITBC|nr:unnamed protein product [Vitrella brassicaformis CCMP3155]|eukprot:CEL93928.1 unnamed protein product [Vitrella brassicaformis CCMP3155]
MCVVAWLHIEVDENMRSDMHSRIAHLDQLLTEANGLHCHPATCPNKTRFMFATNYVETSITMPDVKLVVEVTPRVVCPHYPPEWILPDPRTWVRTKTPHRTIKGNRTTVRFYRYLTPDEKYEIMSVAIKTADEGDAEAQERLYIEMVYLHFVTEAMWANEERHEKAHKMLAGWWRVPEGAVWGN